MPRADLLALDVDELAAMSNRGTVKRALRELENGQPEFTIEETDKALVVSWSDGITCTFPSDSPLQDAICSSGSLGISRHLIRSVLAYQASTGNTPDDSQNSSDERADNAAQTETETDLPASSVWDPGQITDEQLQKQFGKAAVTRARKRFDEGVLGDLSRGKKPTVKFLHDSCTIRFPVPHDLRYAAGDCEQRQLSTWVPQAVWAFRELPDSQLSGLVITGDGSVELPKPAIEQLKKLLAELCLLGVANLPSTWPQRLTRVEGKLEAAKLVWPASLCAAIGSQVQSYRDQDARFDPLELSRLIGESKARMAVIENPANPIPHALVCGPKTNSKTALKSARLVAVGLDARPSDTSVVFRIYFQDSETGSVLVLKRTMTSQVLDQETVSSFDDLGSRLLGDQFSLAQAGKSILVLGSGKRTPTDDLVLPRGRGKFSVNAQSFMWEKLLPPFAAESFEQIKQRHERLPPDWLRPRRGAENLHAIRCECIRDAYFDTRLQRLVATVQDLEGATARLIFPYHSQGRAGFEQFLEAAVSRGDQAKFVSGHIRLENRELVILPVGVVFGEAGEREMLIPWLASSPDSSGSESLESEIDNSNDPIGDFLSQLSARVGDALIVGCQSQQAVDWESLLGYGRAIGFSKILKPIQRIVDDLHGNQERIGQDAEASAEAVGELCVYLRLIA